jgi:hypothetical protein
LYQQLTACSLLYRNAAIAKSMATLIFRASMTLPTSALGAGEPVSSSIECAEGVRDGSSEGNLSTFP